MLDRNKTRWAQREGRFLERGQEQTTEGNLTRMVHAFPREAHNLLSVRNMHHSDQLSTTQQTRGIETISSGLGLGHTIMWLLGTSTISYYQEMAATERPTLLGPYDSAERLYLKKILPHPTQSPITALRTLFGIAILAGSCTLSAPSLSSAAELFPFSPPTSQQRGVDHGPQVRPQLSKEDLNRITRLVEQARKLPAEKMKMESRLVIIHWRDNLTGACLAQPNKQARRSASIPHVKSRS